MPGSFALLLVSALWVASTAAADKASLVGRPAPDFALRSVNGPNVRLSEQRGDVVVVSFWSSRCSTCRAYLQELEQLRDGLRKDNLVVYAVNVDDDVQAAREFAAGLRVSYPLLLDPAKTVARAYRVDSLPLLVTIDRDGVVRNVWRETKSRGPKQADNELRRLLAE